MIIIIASVVYTVVGYLVASYIHRRDAAVDEGQSAVIGALWPVLFPIYLIRRD